MSKLDELGRRKRFTRQPTGEPTHITERALRVLERLHWYGCLPSNYLYPITKVSPTSSEATIKVLLKRMFHERSFRLDGEVIDLPRGAGLIDRPYAQTKITDFPLSNTVIYSISEHGIEVLKKAGRFIENAYQPSGPFLHRLYGSCSMAALEAGTMTNHDLRFIPQHKIIETTQPSYTVGDMTVKNDGVCAVQRISSGRTFYLFIENDRDTERTRMTKDKVKSWERTVIQMKEFLGKDHYKKYVNAQKGDYGLLLNLTVNKGHMAEMVRVVEEHFPKGCKYILSQYYTQFGENYRTPPILPLLSDPWERAGLPDFHITK